MGKRGERRGVARGGREGDQEGRGKEGNIVFFSRLTNTQITLKDSLKTKNIS